MATGVLVINEISRLGKAVEENMVAPTETDGDGFANDGRTFLYIVNGSAGDITVTVDTTGTIDGQALADLTLTVKATGDADGLDKQFLGPFTAMSNQSDGTVKFTCSAVASVLVGAFRLANP